MYKYLFIIALMAGCSTKPAMFVEAIPRSIMEQDSLKIVEKEQYIYFLEFNLFNGINELPERYGILRNEIKEYSFYDYNSPYKSIGYKWYQTKEEAVEHCIINEIAVQRDSLNVYKNKYLYNKYLNKR